MLKILCVFVGAGLGGIFRFLMTEYLSIFFSNTFSNSKFIAIYPYPTLIVNILGSTLIGFISNLLLTKFPNYNIEIKLFLITGLLGGFTTFSSFALESANLLHNNYVYYFYLYIILSVCLCILGCFFGIFLSKIC